MEYRKPGAWSSPSDAAVWLMVAAIGGLVWWAVIMGVLLKITGML